MQPTNKLWVVHDNYGCETGCCGHRIHNTRDGEIGFEFDHPYGVPREEWEAWARVFASEYEGEFDWSRCEISDD